MCDYAELVKALRHCIITIPCNGCPYYSHGDKPSRERSTMNFAAADAIEELVAAVPKWISVEDDLPKANDRVIACVNILGEPSVWDAVRWNGEEWEVEEEAVYEYWTSIDHPVTHWMPLPEPPKGVE